MEDTKCISVFCWSKILKADESVNPCKGIPHLPKRFLRQVALRHITKEHSEAPGRARARSPLADVLDPITPPRVQVTPQWRHEVSVIRKPIIRGKVLTHTMYAIFSFKQNKIIATRQNFLKKFCLLKFSLIVVTITDVPHVLPFCPYTQRLQPTPALHCCLCPWATNTCICALWLRGSF